MSARRFTWPGKPEWVSDATESQGKILIEVYSNRDLTFDDLARISAAFGTRDINLHHEHESSHRYSSWAYEPGYTTVTLLVSDATRWPDGFEARS